MQIPIYASGQSWYVEADKPEGGYILINEKAIYRVWGELQSGTIDFLALKAWFGLHEMKARRCQLDQHRKPVYHTDELARLLDVKTAASTAVRQLEGSGLVSMTKQGPAFLPGEDRRCLGRLIPFPRRLLRMVIRSRGRAVVATVLGHLCRCLFYHRGVCRSGGWCKASWVAETFEVALRAVKSARAKLIELGILIAVQADQQRLNRLGCPMVFAMDWGRRSAPPSASPRSESAPPREHKNLSLRRADHQKRTWPTDRASARRRSNGPDLGNVTEADLQDPWRLAGLFKQARLRGWVCRNEADILAVFAAAAHALRVGTSNPSGLFRWIVSTRSWIVLSLHDEDCARRSLALLKA